MGLDDYLDGFTDMVVGGEGNLYERTGQIFQKSLSVSTLFGPIGDTFDTVGAVTGVDQFSGAKLSGLERWLSALGIGAFGGGVAGGAAMAGLGFPASMLLARGRAQGRASFFEMSQGGRPIKNRDFDVGLSRLNSMEGLRNPDEIFMGTRQKTNDVLRLDFDEVRPKGEGLLPYRRGWDKMANDVIDGYRADGELPTWHPEYEVIGDRRARVLGRMAAMDPNDEVWVFHGTTPEAADAILGAPQAGRSLSVALSPTDASRYGEEVIGFKVKRSELTDSDLGLLTEDGGGSIDQVVDLSSAEIITRNGGMTKAEGQVAGFLEAVFAPRLMERLGSSQAMLTRIAEQGTNVDNPEMAVAAFALSQWEFALDWDQIRGRNLMQGKAAKVAMEEWAKLKSGGNANTELLGEYMTRFAVATDWIQDPELRINPLVSLGHVNLDTEIPQIGLNVARWRQAPLEQTAAQAVQSRLEYMSKMHPSAFTQLAADNLFGLMQNAMAKPPDVDWADWWTDLSVMPSSIESVEDVAEMVRSWRNWYSNAFQQMVDAGTELFPTIDTSVLRHAEDQQKMTTYMTVVASILSGGEDWDSNVPKAIEAVRRIYSNRGKSVKELGEIIKSKLPDGTEGLKVSEADLVKILLLEGLDDPMEIFSRGKAGGLKTEDLVKALDAGEVPENLVDLRKLTEAYQAQKQDSFAYAIWRSSEADLEERSQYMALMMLGEMGGSWEHNLSGNRVVSQNENLRKTMPVVVDRQHFKASIGFALVPDTWLSNNAGPYDQLAQAARIAASRMGEIDGRMVTPEELQAITWMRYRAMSRYTDPQGSNWPNVSAAQEALKNPEKLTPEELASARRTVEIGEQKQAMPMTAGQRRPSSRTARYVPGMGPGFIFSNSIMKYIDGSMTPDLPSTRITDLGTDPTRYRMNVDELGPVDYGMRDAKGWTQAAADDIENLTFEIAPDGTAKILQDADELTELRRGKYFSPAIHNGKQVLRNQQPLPISDVRKWFKRVADSVTDLANPAHPGLTGARLFGWFDPRTPAFQDGPMLSVSGMLPKPGKLGPMDDGWQATTAQIHRRIEEHLMKSGINFTYEDLGSHQGLSTIYTNFDGAGDLPDDLNALPDGVWITWSRDEAIKKLGTTDLRKYMRPHNEARQERVIRFATPEDAHRASQVLMSGEMTTEAAQAALGYMNQRWSGKRNFRRPASDRTAMKGWLGKAHQEVARWYEELPSFTTAEEWAEYHGPEEWARITKAYDAMIADTEDQYQYLVSLGYRMETTVEDPYPVPADMTADLEQNRRLKVFATQPGDHPYLTPEQNDKFRFVHDVFGHMTHEVDFTRFDEDVAFLTHAQMYSEAARPALYSELRSQTATLVGRRQSGQTYIWTPDGKGIEFGDQYISGDTAADIAMALGENPSVENIADTLAASIDQYLPPGAPERDWTRVELEAMAGEIVQAHDFSLFAEQKLALMPTNLMRKYQPRYETMERSLIQKLTRDEVADARFYFDHPTHAPEGLIGGWEHHAVDDSGRHMATISAAGGPHRSNAVQVWLLEDDLGPVALGSRAGALEAGGQTTHSHDGQWWDDMIRIEEGDGNVVLGDGDGRSIWNTKLLTRGDDGKLGESGKVHEFWMMVPGAETGQAPIMTFDEAQARMWPVDRTVKVTKGRAETRGNAKGTKVTVEVDGKKKKVPGGSNPRGMTRAQSSFLLWQVDGEPFPDGDPFLFQDVSRVLLDTNEVPDSGSAVVFGGSRYDTDAMDARDGTRTVGEQELDDE